MNYQKIYDQLIERGKIRNFTDRKIQYFERHHIVPKCMGGSEDDSNKVNLTAREHFLAHWLLYVMNPYNTYLANAFFRCANIGTSKNRNFIPSSRDYEIAKIAAKNRRTESILKQGKTRSRKIKTGEIVIWNKGKKGVQIAWNKGLKYTTKKVTAVKIKKIKKKQVAWNKGLTKETDKRLKIAGKKISKKLIGHIPWNKNKKGINSELTRQRQSNSQRKRFKIHNVWNKGLKLKAA